MNRKLKSTNHSSSDICGSCGLSISAQTLSPDVADNTSYKEAFLVAELIGISCYAILWSAQ